jgi:hypothetical protein
MEDQGQGDELYPIAVLIDELKVCSIVQGRRMSAGVG